jgi:hypothetical protein
VLDVRQFDSVGPTMLTGSGTSGDIVRVVIDGAPIGTTIVDEQGRWQMLVDVQASDSYTLVVESVTLDGVVRAAAEPLAIVIPTETPAPTDTATAAPTDTPTSTSTATATAIPTETPAPTDTATAAPTDTPTSTSTATATPIPTETPAPTDTATAAPTDTLTAAPPVLDVRQFDSVGPTMLTGSGTPGDIVRVVIDGAPIGTTIVDEQGRWQMLVDVQASDSYTLVVESVTLDGVVRAAAEPLAIVIPTETPAPTDTATAAPTETTTNTSTATATAIPTETPVQVAAGQTPQRSRETETTTAVMPLDGTLDDVNPSTESIASGAERIDTAAPDEQLPPTGIDMNGFSVWLASLGALLAVVLLALGDHRARRR